ncbi:MAG: DUF5633 domain-containing protein [Anaerococcus vaginalis]|nr:DUF5633 domain-containing protein [Anaerococcus vaginalis]
MKNNKKLVLGSVVALALSVGVLAPNLTKAEETATPNPPMTDKTNDAPGKTDAQKISEAQAKAKKQLDDAGVPFENQKDVLAYPNNVYNIEQKTNEILAEKKKKDEELAKTPLGKEKLAAKAELKKEGYQLGLYDQDINNATSLYDIEKVKENLRNNKSLKTIDQYNKEEADKKAAEEAAKKPLADAKAKALAELKAAGLGNEKNEYVKRVNEATTVYDVEQAKEAGIEWAKENLTTIDDWNEKENAKTKKLTIDEWLKLQEEKEKGNKPGEKDPEKKPEDDKKPKVTIDEWLLNNAKKDAIEELKAAGITGQIYFDQINKAKTIEGVEALKNEILKAHAGKPGKEDPEKPGEKPEETKNGFDTEREARIAAEKALENDPVNKSYTITQGADGKYYYQLSPVEEGLEIGYETREEAEAAAKEALENDPINNAYEVNQGADGRYYFRLFYKEKEDDKKPEVKPEDDKKPEVKV